MSVEDTQVLPATERASETETATRKYPTPSVNSADAAEDARVRIQAQRLVDLVAKNEALVKRAEELEESLAAIYADKSKTPGQKLGAGLKKFGASLLAAVTTPEAIKVEKSLAVVALTRALILVPSLAATIDLILAALGAPHVSAK